MSGTSVVRKHLIVSFADREDVEVFTNVVDHRLFPVTAKRHGWPSQSEDPVGYISFVAWSAARRTGQIAGLTYEAWEQSVVDVVVLEEEVVVPTEPEPGTGSSVS